MKLILFLNNYVFFQKNIHRCIRMSINFNRVVYLLNSLQPNIRRAVDFIIIYEIHRSFFRKQRYAVTCFIGFFSVIVSYF